MKLTYEDCALCPRLCRVNRYEAKGFCGAGPTARVARAALHHWEEPCISGSHGSGAVFFSHCTLKCVFCQNYPLSHEGFGKDVTPERLSEIFLNLQEQGAHNINLVTATHYLPSVIEALDLAKPRLSIPVVYNCGGYERVETIRALKGYVDIYLPDLKYYDDSLGRDYSHVKDYFSMAAAAIKEMIAQTGGLSWSPESTSENGLEHGPETPALLKKGVLIRHMVLPGSKEDSFQLLRWMAEELPRGQFLFSIMSQYTPFYKSCQYPKINRRITSYEYQKVVDLALELGLTDGYMQKKSSAKEEYTPPFDLTGI